MLLPTRRGGGWLPIYVVLQLAFGLAGSHAEEPVITKLAFVGDDAFLPFSPGTTNWVALEGSADLDRWTEVADLATTNGVTYFEDPAVADAYGYQPMVYPEHSLAVASSTAWGRRV